MPIECEIDTDRSLLICTATCELDFEQIKAVQEKYFEKYLTQNVILDLSLISANELEPSDVETIVKMAEINKNLRPANGKTALVASSPSICGLSRMYAVFFELKELPWEVEIFCSMDEALEWIGSKVVIAPEHAFQSGRVSLSAG